MNLVTATPAHATDAPDTITMYGADWCGDCRRAKAFFAEHDIEFDFVDLVEHEAGTDVVLARNAGVQKIPVIIFPDNSHLTEPTNADLEAKMAGLANGDSTADGSSDLARKSTANDAASEALPTEAVSLEDVLEAVVVENAAEGRFELRRGEEVLSIADYTERDGGVVVVPHVGTDPQHRGEGNAGRLMDGLLAQLRDSERKVLPLCPFAASHINRNPQHADLVA